MQKVGQKVVAVHLLLLAAGAFIGWLYDHVDWGLLTAALLALGWQLRQLLRFETALRNHHFGSLKYGDGIWSQLYSRFNYQRNRARRYRKRYRQLLKDIRNSTNAMPDGGIVLNGTFEIVHCNTAAVALAGFKRKKDRGQRVDNLLRDPEFSAYLKAGDFSNGIEIRSPVVEGGWLHCRMVPFAADESLLLLQDITERRRLASVRREFVANASHELRSPLTVISGYLDTLATDDDVPAAWRQPIGQMQNQAGRMNRIVAELLELSRLESAGVAPRDEIVDVCGLLSAARQSLAGRENIASIEIDCDTRLQLRGKGGEIESVIVNLLSNAVRHTPADGVITLAWHGNASGAQLTVSDTGSGIEALHIPRLTERFFRVDPGRARADGGVGLGLAIVKYILERHGAVLKIESTPGRGSSFVCHFPVARVATTGPAPASDGSATG